MALEIQLQDPQRGISAQYWRIANIAIRLHPGAPEINVQVDGFTSAEIRAQPDGQAQQFRHLRAVGNDAMALMLRSAGAVLREQGIDVDSWPAEQRVAVDGLTFYAQAASTLYGLAKGGEFAGAVDVV